MEPLVGHYNKRDMIISGITISGVKCIASIGKWFGIGNIYYNKRVILLTGMILSGTHCIMRDNC